MFKFLLFARRQDLRVISLDVSYRADVVLPVGRTLNANIVAVDFDPVER